MKGTKDNADGSKIEPDRCTTRQKADEPLNGKRMVAKIFKRVGTGPKLSSWATTRDT